MMTSMTLLAETEALGIMMKIAATIIKDINTWVAYCKNAIMSPICIMPISTCLAPIQIIRIETPLIKNVMTGVTTDISLFKNIFRFVISLLTPSNLFSSVFSLLNARITNMPSNCSLVTRFSLSTNFWEALNLGSAMANTAIIKAIIPATVQPNMPAKEG